MAYFTGQAQKQNIYRGFNLIYNLGKIQDVGQDEPIKMWKKHMCREARAEMSVANAWSWILIGSENEGRYASWSGSEATNKWRCQSTHQTLIFTLNIKALLQFCC